MGDLMRLAGLRRFFHGWVFVGVFNILQIAFCMGGIAVAHAARLRSALAELGLLGRFGRAAAFSFIAVLPMLLVFGLTSPINSKISFLSVGVGCFLAPFAEEVLFRGYCSVNFIGGHAGVFGCQRSFPRRFLRSDMLTGPLDRWNSLVFLP
jgi:hypothetical protein